MKRATNSKTFPSNKAEWDAAIADAPDRVPYDPETDSYNPNDRKAVAAAMKNAVVVRGGGIAAVRQALAAKRRPGQSGSHA